MFTDRDRQDNRLKELDTVYAHGRILSGPNHIAYDITNRCNLKCLHCYNRSGNDFVRDELSDDDVRTMVDQLCEIRPRSFCFCGGEPLLRKELIFEATNKLAREGTNVAMVTNGLLMTKEIAKELRKQGMVLIQISLDGATAKSHDRLRGKDGAFAGAINALEILSAVDFPTIGIAFCPTSFNIHEVETAMDMAKQFGAQEFRVQPLMLLGRAVVNRHDILPSEQQYLEMVRLLSRKDMGSMRVEWGDPVDHLIRFSRLLPEAVPYLDIKSDGRIATSTYLPLSIGNVRTHTLPEYWEAGLARVWTSPLVQKLAGMIRSTRDFYRPDAPIPMVFYEEHLHVDLIDDGLLTMSDEQAERLIIKHCSKSDQTA